MDSSENIIFIQTDSYIKDVERYTLAWRLMLAGNQSERGNHVSFESEPCHWPQIHIQAMLVMRMVVRG